MDRRYFIQTSGITMASFGLMAAAPDVLHQFAAAQTSSGRSFGRRKVLVNIFQRGAVDGMSMIVPYGDREYYDLRRATAISQPGKKDGAIDLDGHFGLHPSMTAFEPLWRDKRLAIVNACGSPDNTRSHFDAQDYMESGTPGIKSTRDGWLNRTAQTLPQKNVSPFRSVAVTRSLPRSLYGTSPSVAMTSINDFNIRAGQFSADLRGGFEGIYQQESKEGLGDAGKETFEAVNFLRRANPAQFKPENGAVYPASQLGRSLQQIAQLIKSGVGLEIAFAECGGWDTHLNQGGATGQLANLLRDLSRSIAAFTLDLGDRMDDVLIVTMSEFGRTARENGTRGTDHGHGNAMMIIGNHIKGGKVYGEWKGLKNDQLNEGRDLPVTTDFRDVLSEAAAKHLGTRDKAKLFPNYASDSPKIKGLMG